MIEDSIKSITIFFVVLGVFLSLAVWLKRSLARLIIFYEVIHVTIYFFCPLDFGEFDRAMIFFLAFYSFIAYGSH